MLCEIVEKGERERKGDGVLQTKTAGSHYTSELLVHVRTLLSLKHTAAPMTPGLF